MDSAKLVTDSGRSRGSGFIEMASDHDAESAIAALNDGQVGGRALMVDEARSKESGFGGGKSGGRSGNRERSGRGGGGYRY